MKQMKKVIMPLAWAFAVVNFAACGNSDNSEAGTADSISATSTTTTTDEQSSNAAASTSTSEASDSAGTQTKSRYVDLSTGSQVNVTKDAKTGYYVNTETQKPVDFYLDPS